MSNTDIPPPGSNEAVRIGCTCPQMDNAYGRGYMGGVTDTDGNTVYVYSIECTVHSLVASPNNRRVKR